MMKPTAALAILSILATAACELAEPFQGPGFDPGKGLTTDAEGPFVVATTRLVLTPDDSEAQSVFDAQMTKLNAALETQPGFIGHSLSVKLFDPAEGYRTLSVWEDEEAMLAWVVGDAHLEAMGATAEHVEAGQTATWTITREEMPPSWEDAKAHLDEHGREAY